MSSRPTIADVARTAGVSKGLVSSAFNGSGSVAAATRERILGVARDLGWSPSLQGRSLSTGRAFACGLVIGRSPDVIAADPFFPSLIAGLEDVLSSTDQVLVLAVAAPGGREDDVYRRLAVERRVDGVVITDVRVDDPRPALVASLGLTAITLGRPEDDRFGSVSMDDAAGVRDAVRHLADLGHRRVGHVAGPADMLHARRRREAFEGAARDAGVEFQVVETDFGARAGASATATMLARPEAPTALVYANDLMAIAGIGVAQRRGLDVPADLSVVGFDDTDIGAHLHPPLTSVRTDARAWGARTAEALLGAMAGALAAHETLAAPSLIIRASTAPPRLAHP